MKCRRNSFRLQKWVFVWTLLVLVTACGGGEGPALEPANEPADRPMENQSHDAGAASVVRRFDFQATGVELAAPLPEPSALSVSGGCVDPSPLSIGFFHGAPHEPGYFGFSINSATPVPPGYVGDVELTEIDWDNGVMRPENLPADSPIRGPVRYQGTGTLKIESHSGRGMAGRMSGTVTGEVSRNKGEEAASLVVDFDINLACAD